MSEEKHVVEHEQQKKEKTKKRYRPRFLNIMHYNLYSCTITPGTFKSAIMAKADV